MARTWRTVLWREGAPILAAISARLGAPVEPSGFGWTVSGRSVQVWVRGGVLGVRTVVRGPDGEQVFQGWIPEEHLERLGGGVPSAD